MGLPGFSQYHRHHSPMHQGKGAQGSHGVGMHSGTLQGGSGGWPNTTAEAAAASQPITTAPRGLTTELPPNSLTRGKTAGVYLPHPSSYHQQSWLPPAVRTWQQFPASSWSKTCSSRSPQPPPPHQLLQSISGQQLQMFGKTNLQGN